MTEINSFEDISLVTFSEITPDQGIVSGVLGAVAAAGISIDMISATPPKSDRFSFGFTFEDKDIPKLLTVMGKITARVGVTPLVNSGNVKLVIKSSEMENQAGFAARVLAVAEELSAPILLITTGVDEISLLLPDGYSEEMAFKLKEILQ